MAKKKSTKMSISLFITLLIVAIGVVAGFFVTQKITENDKFVINGEKVVEVEVGGSYVDTEGATVISFGKDLSNLVKSETNVDFNTPGQYYIKYTVDNFRFRGVERFRIIKVVEVEDEGV